jgi:hypothetical protein
MRVTTERALSGISFAYKIDLLSFTCNHLCGIEEELNVTPSRAYETAACITDAAYV